MRCVRGEDELPNDMFRDGVDPATDAAELLAQLAAATHTITATSASDPFEQVVATIIGDAAGAVRADRAAVWLERDNSIAVIATTGIRAASVDRFHRVEVPEETIAKSALRRGTSIVWTTHMSAQRYFPHITAQDLGSGFVSPLHVGGEYAGVLFIGWATEHRRLRTTERSFLEAIADTCAIAVERSEQLQERDDASVDGIVAIGDTFGITVTSSGVETVVWVTGEIDVSNIDQFAHCLQHITESNTNERLILDLTGVEFLSVAAARLVLSMSQGRTPRGAAVEVRNTSANVQRVFDVVSSN